MRYLVNGRFLTMPVTGVQRYARGLLGALPQEMRQDTSVLLPPRRLVSVSDALAGSVTESAALRGIRGHFWEQALVPTVKAQTQLHLAHFGPVVGRNFILVLHDAGPFVYPSMFAASYRTLVRTLWPILARRARKIVCSSAWGAEELTRVLGVSPEKLEVISPGIDDWILRIPDLQLDTARGSYGLIVGIHDPRKNLDFLLQLWPRVWANIGLRLVATARGSSLAHRTRRLSLEHPWLEVITDPSDAELKGLYEHAAVVLSPSLYEGYGLPLLEAAACGTPFISTDCGAASSLAVEPWQVLPLSQGAWIAAIGHIAEAGSQLAEATRHRALTQTWDRAGRQLAAVMRNVS